MVREKRLLISYLLDHSAQRYTANPITNTDIRVNKNYVKMYTNMSNLRSRWFHFHSINMTITKASQSQNHEANQESNPWGERCSISSIAHMLQVAPRLISIWHIFWSPMLSQVLQMHSSKQWARTSITFNKPITPPNYLLLPLYIPMNSKAHICPSAGHLP